MKIQTSLGTIVISNEVFTTISGYAATNCFGVKGMATRNVQDGLVQLLRMESLSRGVRVFFPEDTDQINIELHIVVEHGVNIPALCSSIMSEVRYIVERLTGVSVGSVDVCVDSIMTGS